MAKTGNTQQEQETFKDVTLSNPNYIFIKFLSKRGLLKGFPDGTFKPAAGLSRAEAAAVLAKAAGLESDSARAVFKDINPNHWAAASIAAAKDAGLITGYPDGTFRPEAKLTRAEGITLILKLSNQPDPGEELPVLEDIASKHWAAGPVAVGLASDMVGLASDSKHFLPDANLTRGSLARALAVLLTKDQTLYETSLSNSLNVVSGSVTVIPTGSQTAETITGSTELQPGDTVNTGVSGMADITFPDGTGLRLNKGTKFTLKEAKGRLYIKPDGTPGTAVEWLAVDLQSGRIFGALAATDAETNVKTAAAPVRAMGLGNLSENRVRTAALTAANPLPWWKKSSVKRTKVKVDMPTGVAAIRGTFWENKVNPDGTFGTTLLTGSAEITAGGKTVDLTGGQRTEVPDTGAPPAPPVPLTTEDKKEWVNQKDWAQARAQEIAAQQPLVLPPPPPAEEPEEPVIPPQQPEEPQIPIPEQTQIVPDITSIIKSALDNAEESTTPSVDTGSDDEENDYNTASSNTTVTTKETHYNVTVHPTSLIPADNPITANTTEITTADTVGEFLNNLNQPPGSSWKIANALTIPGAFETWDLGTISGRNSSDFLQVDDLLLVQAQDSTLRGYYIALAGPDGGETIPVAGIQLNTHSLDLNIGDSPVSVTAFVYPDYATNTSVTWTSSNPSVASVVYGEITPIAEGSATITVTTVDGGFYDYCTVTVTVTVTAPPAGDDSGGGTTPASDTTFRISSVELSSISSDGTQANESSGGPDSGASMSRDGRYVAFLSYASNLVEWDTNSATDIFVRDRLNGTTVRVSVTSDGTQGNSDSRFPKLTPDGRYVVFTSRATNLVADDTNGSEDVFVHDRDADNDGTFDETYQDTKLTVTVDGNPVNGYSYEPSISEDGRYVAFTSGATNLSPYDSNSANDIFLCDTSNMVLKRVSAPPLGGDANGASWYQAISGDGSSVAFTSEATNLAAGDTNYRSDIIAVSLDLDSPPDCTPPTAPTGLQAADSGPGWINLAWNPATDDNNIVQYAVYRGTDISGPFTNIANLYGSVYSYWDTVLSSSTSYYYYVLAKDEDGNVSAVPTPVQLNTTAVPNAVSLAAVPVTAGYEYSLARLDDGSAWAWGANADGKLGIGTSSSTTTPQQVVYDTTYFTGVAAMDAYNHTLAVKDDGTVWAWGSNITGQLGISPDNNDHTTPVQVTGLTNITDIAVGDSFSLALSSDGTIWSWGENYKGQLGNRFNDSEAYSDYIPMRVVSPDGTGYLTDVKAIAVGYYTSMALKADGTVWTWGDNNYGNLGIGTKDNYAHPIPVQVPALTDIIAISVGNGHNMALKSDGTVWTWGYNYYGQLGDNTTSSSYSPVQVVDPTDASGYLTGVADIAAGWYHSVALKSDGTVWTWGDNDYYTLGDGTWNDRTTPVQVLGPGGTGDLSGITAIAADFSHNLAFRIDGTIWAWGSNYSRQLGDGTNTNSSSPVQVIIEANIPLF